MRLYLYDEERDIINHIAKHQTLSEFSKKELLECLEFGNAALTEEVREMFPDLYPGLIDKVKDMTEQDWEDIKGEIPLEVSYYGSPCEEAILEEMMSNLPKDLADMTEQDWEELEEKYLHNRDFDIADD